MTTTIAPKRPKKEPSLAKVARQYARGIKDVTPLAFDPFPDVELKADLQKLSDCPPQKLSIADQIWCGTTAKQKAPLDGVKRECAIKLIKQHLRGATVEYAKPNGNGHPALTGTTTPAGILANDPDAIASVPGKDGRTFRDILRSNRSVPEDLAAAAESGAEVEIECERIQVNPDNDHASEKDPEVVALAESIAADKLLQAITVRPTPLAGRENPQLRWKDFEIICGERRWLACQVAGLATVRCKIRTDADDAQALRLMVIENAKRRNVNPIVKARNIERLCQPKDEGGGGLTRDQAAKDVGLTDGSSASNLVRLLKLPKIWQERVAAGELPESFARLILPVMELPPVMKHLEAEWKERGKNDWNAFTSRDRLEEGIDEAFCDCRRLDQSRYVGSGKAVMLKVDLADEQLRKTLGIVEVELPPTNGRKGPPSKVAVATNAKAFDDMLDKQVGKATKGKAAKFGSDEKPAAKREPTAAEKKQRAMERGKQLAARIHAWRDKLLRREIIAALSLGIDDGLRLLLSYVPQSYRGPKVWELIEKVTKKKGQHDQYCEYLWAAVGDLKTADRMETILRETARALLAAVEPDDWRRPVMAPSLVEAYAADLAIEIQGAWNRLQQPSIADPKELHGEDLLEEFFLFHQTAELQALAKELGVYAEGKPRGIIVQMLLAYPRGSGRRLKLPSCIKPLAVPGKRKAKRGK